MPIPKNALKGPGYYAVQSENGYEVTFDPGAHKPQEITVHLTSEEFWEIWADPSKFSDIVVPAMERQGVQVL